MWKQATILTVVVLSLAAAARAEPYFYFNETEIGQMQELPVIVDDFTVKMPNGNYKLFLGNIPENAPYQGKWYRVEEAPSLKESRYIKPVFKEVDPNYNVVVKDYNWTSITIDVSTHAGLLNTDIPIEVYREITELNEKEELITTKETLTETEVNLKSTEEMAVFTLPTTIGDVVKIGENSTVISMTAYDGYVLDDAYVYKVSPDSNYSGTTSLRVEDDNTYVYHTYYEINSQEIPAYSNIINASLSLYLGSNLLDVATEGFNVTVVRIINKTDWSEYFPTWNNKESLGAEGSVSPTSLYYFGGAGEPNAQRESWNVTQIVQDCVDESTNITFFIKPHDYFGSASNDPISYYSKEYVSSTYQLVLTVVYEEGSPPPEDTLNPTFTGNVSNTSDYNTTSVIGFKINFTDETAMSFVTLMHNQSGSWENLSAGCDGTSCNVTINLSITEAAGANVAWQFFGNDTSSNTNSTAVRNFDITETYTPNPYPVFHANGTNVTSINRSMSILFWYNVSDDFQTIWLNLEHNISGTYVNETMPIVEAFEANVTIVLNTTDAATSTFCTKAYVSDNEGAINSTEQACYYYYNPSTDSCTDFEQRETNTIDCSDNCAVDAATDAGGATITFINGGHIHLDADVTNWTKVERKPSTTTCTVTCRTGCFKWN